MASPNLTPYLERLEALIDLDHVARTRELHRRAFAFEPVEHVPTVILYQAPDEEWPRFTSQEIYDDPAKMLLSQLHDVYVGAKLQDDRLYGIRADYGSGIIASIFGSPTALVANSLPVGLAVTPDRLAAILAGEPPPAIADGAYRSLPLLSRAFDTVAYYRETLRPYPKLARAVGSQMLDIQGPFDNASIIWGSAIFAALYEAPEQVVRLMEQVVDVTLAVVREHRRIDGCPLDEHDGAWQMLGGLCVRNDSSICVGPRHYRGLIRGCDERLLAPYGGWMHFCGRAAWWPDVLGIPNLRGINPYQGEFYDLYSMYERCEAARMSIVQWTKPLDRRCRERIRTGFSRIIWAADYDAARRLVDRLHATGHADSEEEA
ncbi:MAG: hypothetical protein BWY52_03197 [Chloroflexi bacterium ADurb.Bin325]|nr:MAG: hypothetical protein BWY52_03197 [Chloroflexi bacterium ADurb.Bin325]